MKFKKCHTFQNVFVAFFQKINAHYFPNFCNNALLHYLIFKNNALLHISRKSNAIMKCITAIMHYWKSDMDHKGENFKNKQLFYTSKHYSIKEILIFSLSFFFSMDQSTFWNIHFYENRHCLDFYNSLPCWLVLLCLALLHRN